MKTGEAFSWRQSVSRRTFLRGAAGITLALPWMESLALRAADTGHVLAKAEGILGILNDRRLTGFNVQQNSFVICCLAQDAQFLGGQLIRLFLPDRLVNDAWNQHDAWASGQPGKSSQRFESPASYVPHAFIRVVDGLPKIENEAFASLQTQIVQTAVDCVGDGSRVLRRIERVDLRVAETDA